MRLITKMGLDETHPVLTIIGQDNSGSTTSNLDCLEMRSVKKPTIKTFWSRHQFRCAQADETNSYTNNSRLGVGCKSGEGVSQG